MDSFRITETTQIRQGPELHKQVTSGFIQSEQPRDGKEIAEAVVKAEYTGEKNKTKSETNVPDKNELLKAAQKINKALKHFNTKIQINFDDDTGKMVIHLVDSESGDTVRQIPSETLLKLSANIAEYLGDWPDKENIAEGAVIDKLI